MLTFAALLQDNILKRYTHFLAACTHFTICTVYILKCIICAPRHYRVKSVNNNRRWLSANFKANKHPKFTSNNVTCFGFNCDSTNNDGICCDLISPRPDSSGLHLCLSNPQPLQRKSYNSGKLGRPLSKFHFSNFRNKENPLLCSGGAASGCSPLRAAALTPAPRTRTQLHNLKSLYHVANSQTALFLIVLSKFALRSYWRGHHGNPGSNQEHTSCSQFNTAFCCCSDFSSLALGCTSGQKDGDTSTSDHKKDNTSTASTTSITCGRPALRNHSSLQSSHHEKDDDEDEDGNNPRKYTKILAQCESSANYTELESADDGANSTQINEAPQIAVSDLSVFNGISKIWDFASNISLFGVHRKSEVTAPANTHPEESFMLNITFSDISQLEESLHNLSTIPESPIINALRNSNTDGSPHHHNTGLVNQLQEHQLTTPNIPKPREDIVYSGKAKPEISPRQRSPNRESFLSITPHRHDTKMKSTRRGPYEIPAAIQLKSLQKERIRSRSLTRIEGTNETPLRRRTQSNSENCSTTDRSKWDFINKSLAACT